LKPEVLKSFDEIFEAKKEDLTNLALVGIKGLLLLEEHRSDEFHGEEEDKNGGESGVERLSRAANVNQNDGVSTSLAQRFLKNIVEIATASQGGYALTATEVIGSILRQGLVHPKEVRGLILQVWCRD
jgi:cohesin loading factor subunit SCC2